MNQNPGNAKPGRSTPEIVRVARDLNRSGLWTIYRRGPGGWRASEKVEAVTLGDGLQPAPEGLTLAFIHDGRVEVVA